MFSKMMFSPYVNTHRMFKRLAMALIRLRVCAGWFEPFLVAHTTLLESRVAAQIAFAYSEPLLPVPALSIV